MLHPSTPERVSAIQIDQSLTRLPRTPEHSKPSLPTISELASKLRRDREIAKTRRLIRRQDNEEILPRISRKTLREIYIHGGSAREASLDRRDVPRHLDL